MNSLSTQRDVKRGFRRYFARLAAGLALAAVVAGCAAVKPRAAEEIVKERAQARWDALVKGDANAAYAFMSPGSRAVLTAEAYVNSIRVGFWKSAQVNKVECGTEQACEAHGLHVPVGFCYWYRAGDEAKTSRRFWFSGLNPQAAGRSITGNSER